jgi:predicted RNA-binding protein
MSGTQTEAQPQVQPQVVAPRVSPEEEKVREELQTIFLDLLTSAQKVAYELATIDMTKETFTRDELKDFFNASKEVVSNVKRMHKFLEKHGRRR